LGESSGSNYWTITNSYALTGSANNFAPETNRPFTNSGFKTQEELKRKDTYGVWNFTSIWGIDQDKNNGFLYLRGVGIGK